MLGLGVLYPSYASHKAMKSEDGSLQKNWMSYWIVHSILTSALLVAESCLFVSTWFPFYYDIKTLFIIFMITPITSENSLGSSIVYIKIVCPCLVRKENGIDQAILDIQRECLNPERVCSHIMYIAAETFIWLKNRMVKAVEEQQMIMNGASAGWPMGEKLNLNQKLANRLSLDAIHGKEKNPNELDSHGVKLNKEETKPPKLGDDSGKHHESQIDNEKRVGDMTNTTEFSNFYTERDF